MVNIVPILKLAIKLNGAYDILCAISILNLMYIPFLRDIHLSMIQPPIQDPIVERFFAYWIFTYGIIRLHDNTALISYSYYIEAFFILNEYIHTSICPEKAIFIVITSLLLGMSTI